jgi:hypothetical protein
MAVSVICNKLILFCNRNISMHTHILIYNGVRIPQLSPQVRQFHLQFLYHAE